MPQILEGELIANIDMEEMIEMTSIQEGRLETNRLKRYHKDLTRIVTQAVNFDGCRYRFGTNLVFIYPLDGTAPVAVRQHGDDRQVQMIQSWYDEHVGPIAHPENYPAPSDPEDAIVPVSEIPTPAEVHIAPVRVEEPEDVAALDKSGPWRPYIHTDQRVSTAIQINTHGVYKCMLCADDATRFYTGRAKSATAHANMGHGNRGTIDSPESRAKAVETRRSNRLSAAMRDAVEILCGAMGETVPLTDYEAMKVRAEEAEAKLAIMREAMGL